MAIYTNLPIYKAAYTLLLDLTRMLPDMPRDCRYSLGQEVRQRAMHIILLIYRANRTRHKVPLIVSMRDTLLEVQVYMRLMCDLHYISVGKYTALAEHTADMSRQMSAWEKSEYRKKCCGDGGADD